MIEVKCDNCGNTCLKYKYNLKYKRHFCCPCSDYAVDVHSDRAVDNLYNRLTTPNYEKETQAISHSIVRRIK